VADFGPSRIHCQLSCAQPGKLGFWDWKLFFREFCWFGALTKDARPRGSSEFHGNLDCARRRKVRNPDMERWDPETKVSRAVRTFGARLQWFQIWIEASELGSLGSRCAHLGRGRVIVLSGPEGRRLLGRVLSERAPAAWLGAAELTSLDLGQYPVPSAHSHRAAMSIAAGAIAVGANPISSSRISDIAHVGRTLCFAAISRARRARVSRWNSSSVQLLCTLQARCRSLRKPTRRLTETIPLA